MSDSLQLRDENDRVRDDRFDRYDQYRVSPDSKIVTSLLSSPIKTTPSNKSNNLIFNAIKKKQQPSVNKKVPNYNITNGFLK